MGRTAPPYSARTLSGDRVSLQQLAGRPVLLNVWATWCEPCRIEIPFLVQLYKQDSAAGLEIVGVSVDAPGQQKRIASYVDEMGMQYPIWFDPDRRVMTTFLAYGVPASYLIDRDGKLRWRHVGVLRATNDDFMAALEGVLRQRKGDTQ